MPSYSYDRMTPRVHPTAYVHPSAQLLADVELAEEVSVWPTAVLRGDNGFVKVGARTNIQDGSICHGTLGISTTTVGSQVTVGHRVTLHGCKVGDNCLVGMGSILLDNVEIGAESFIAAGSLITPGKKYEPRSFIIGSPAKRVREVTAKDLEAIAHAWKTYQELARKYRLGL
jgi:carbonic anhydrase/acetyltransferase-like protein (isoleucine patch superfamily)